MEDAAYALLKDIMAYYPFDGGGNCTKAAVFHSHMLNTFQPKFNALFPPVAYQPTEPDEETPFPPESIVGEEE